MKDFPWDVAGRWFQNAPNAGNTLILPLNGGKQLEMDGWSEMHSACLGQGDLYGLPDSLWMKLDLFGDLRLLSLPATSGLSCPNY